MPNSKSALWCGRTFIALALLIGVVSIFGFARYSRFHSRIETLKANGELPSIEELAYEVEDPEEDALAHLRKIFDSAKEFNTALAELEAAGPTVSRSGEEAMRIFDELSSKHPDLFATISLACAAPDMSYRLVIDDPGDLMSLAAVMRTIDWKCEIQIARGKNDDAVDTAVELFRLGNLKSQRGTLIDSLLAVAMRRLASSRLVEASAQKSLSAERLEIVKSLISEFDPIADLQRSLLFERALATYGMINVDELREKEGAQEDLFDNPTAALTMYFNFGPAVVVGNHYLDSMETAIDNCELPLSKNVNVEAQEDSFILSAFGGDSGPFYERIRLAFGEAVAQGRILQVALALDAAPDAADRDNWPVEYLVGIGVSAEATIDPFDDQPLKIKHKDGRWIVYSSGRDRNDDGGNAESDCGFLER